MTTDINNAIEKLYEVLKQQSPKNTTSMTIYFNYEGFNIESSTKNPDALKDNVISMRNLRGEWIK